MGKQRSRRCCCLRAQVASEGVNKWGNVSVLHREWKSDHRGRLIPLPVCSIQAKISWQRLKAGPTGISARAAYQGRSSCSPTAPGSFHCCGSCSCTELCRDLTGLLPWTTASPAHTSQRTKYSSWKLPVRQRECTTGKDKLEKEVVRGKRGSALCYTFSLPPVFRVHFSQHELVLAAVFNPSRLGIWDPEPWMCSRFLRIHSESSFGNCWSSLTSSTQNWKPNNLMPS